MSFLKHCRSFVSVLTPRAFYSTSKNNNNNDNNMSSKTYWDSFYTHRKNKKTNTTTNFEWLLDSTCLEHLTCLLDQSNEITFIADIGCGSSHFSSDLSSQLSRLNLVICADFSLEPLAYLKTSQSARLLSDYIQCDCKRLPFRRDFFDLIVDKGYLDSVLKQMSLVSTEQAMRATHESLRTLVDKLDATDRKYLVQITDEQPELRFDLLDEFKLKYALNISYFYKEISFNEFVYYAYFISKQQQWLNTVCV